MKRRNVTLIEIMIVIVLIGLIGSVVAYNMRGSLDEGKAFKTRHGGAQLYNILMLEIAKGADPDETVDNWQEVIEASPLVSKAADLKKDGWGKEYTVTLDGEEILVSSDAYNTYSKREEFLR